MDKIAKVKFYNIEERDTDFAIIRSFINNQSVRNLFFNKIGKSGDVVKVYHSLMDKESDGHEGESDIVIICENKDERFAIFIEDKIAADPQPSQRKRYDDRAKSLEKIEGYGDNYFVFLCAPQAYLDTEKASDYKELVVSHEMICNSSDDLFDRAVFNFSTIEKKQGYSPLKDDNVTEFWDKLYNHVEKYFPDIRKQLPKVEGARGSRASWPAIKTSVKGLVIRWKTSKNCVDLEFAGMNENDSRREYLSKLLNELHIHGYPISDTKKSLSISKNLSFDEDVSFHKPFESQVIQINKCLSYVLDFLKIADQIYRYGIYEFPRE